MQFIVFPTRTNISVDMCERVLQISFIFNIIITTIVVIVVAFSLMPQSHGNTHTLRNTKHFNNFIEINMYGISCYNMV